MPEGDAVFRTARALHRAFAGRRLTASDLRVPELATVRLADWTVIESTSLGKHLLLRMRPPEQIIGEPPVRDMTLHSHLGMDGSWRVYAVGERWRGQPRHLIRAVLRTVDAIAVGYQLHQLALIPTEQEKDLLGHLGPDLLAADWDPIEAVRRIGRRPSATIAEALLDQRNLAGIGNVYCNELLFLRGTWPWTPVRQVSDVPGLVSLARRLLEANRARAVRSTTGSLRRGETTYVYGRAGEPCRRCGSTIMMDGTGERIIYWCPSCQPGPSQAAPRGGSGGAAPQARP